MTKDRALLRVVRGSCAVLALSAGLARTAQAQTVPQSSQPSVNAQIELLKQQLEASAKQMEQFRQALDALTAAQAQSDAKIAATQTQASQAKAAADAVVATEDLDSNGHAFLEHKKVPGLTFYVPHGEITGYGNIDVSFDYVAKNVGGEPANYAASPPIGNFSSRCCERPTPAGTARRRVWEAHMIRRPRPGSRNCRRAIIRVTSRASTAATVRRMTGWRIAASSAGCRSLAVSLAGAFAASCRHPVVSRCFTMSIKARVGRGTS